VKHIALAVLSTFLILSTCNSWAGDLRVPLSATGGVRNDFESPNSGFTVIANLIKSWDGALSKPDRAKHTGAVIFALENAEDGQIVEWYSPNEETSGKIKPLMTWMVQGGHCRKLVSLIVKGDRAREYEEVGCRTMDTEFWTFSRR
jgi:surface antigen